LINVSTTFHHHVTACQSDRLCVTTDNHRFIRLHETMEDYGFDLDELLEDRQDLSQYSYDPEDRLDTVTIPDSQQSSQESDKTDIFLGVFDEQKTAADDLDVEPVLTSDYPCPPTVTKWLVNCNEVNPVSSSQESPLLPLGVELEDTIEVSTLVKFYYLLLQT